MLCDTMKYHMVNVDGKTVGVCLATDVDRPVRAYVLVSIQIVENYSGT